MKKHAIIPIFIPNMGCQLSCVFCDQKTITARSHAPSPEEVREVIDTWLTTLTGEESSPTVEIAFYGGSFTAIPISMQETYLSIAKEYVDRGIVKNIHISTRPDCIDQSTLDRLAEYHVKTIELGVQSFSDEVLALSKRGHDAAAVYKACEFIKSNPFFNLGIQLMIGLPGDSLELDIYSAKETVKLAPNLARIYPTLVLDGTELMDMYKSGLYNPLTREDAILRTKAVYEILDEAGIFIMRVGLKSTDIINSDNLGTINEGAYHPAFRQLVESEIAKERIEKLILEASHRTKDESFKFTVYSSPSWLSNAIGQNGSNRLYFQKKYPKAIIDFREKPSLEAGQFEIEFTPSV